MSDPKRATLITVGAPKSEKNNVTKTVRLTINLDESNESKYPELNYKELVRTSEKKQKTPNGKTNNGLDPFSDNDDDVERVARKFEQKYGSKSTYGSKGRSKHDEYADIGAGYDENDSFIDNTDGYDEMIPPGCDTLYGGFYINCGSLEFKAVPDNHVSTSDGETQGNNKRHKRRISSSSSEDESSESSSEQESPDEKDPKSTLVNGNSDSLNSEHRKMKSKKLEKSKAKRIRRDSPTTNSGKQTSDENNQCDAESADSRTSHSDSVTSKPAPSSENPATSDSSRDAPDFKFPPDVNTILDEISACMTRLTAVTSITAKEFESATDPLIIRLQRTVTASHMDARLRRSIWNKAALILLTTYNPLTKRARGLVLKENSLSPSLSTNSAQTSQGSPERAQVKPGNTRLDTINELSETEKEERIVQTLERLKSLIDEKSSAIMLNYKLECERVQQEKNKLKVLSDVSQAADSRSRRLPKRRFPWCARSRAYLATLTTLAGDDSQAATLLALRALPLFPSGFVRIPTLLRQANLNRDLSSHIKTSDLKKSISLPPQAPIPSSISTGFNEPIHFPSSLTVTTSIKTPEKPHETNSDTNEDEIKKKRHKNNTTKEPYLPSIFGAFNLSKELILDCKNSNKQVEKTKDTVTIERASDKSVENKHSANGVIIAAMSNPKPDMKVKPNNVIAFTSDNKKDQSIRVKSQATLAKEADELVKKDKIKSQKEKTQENMSAPSFIDTSYKDKKPEQNPSCNKQTHKPTDNTRVLENKLKPSNVADIKIDQSVRVKLQTMTKEADEIAKKDKIKPKDKSQENTMTPIYIDIDFRERKTEPIFNKQLQKPTDSARASDIKPKSDNVVVSDCKKDQSIRVKSQATLTKEADELAKKEKTKPQENSVTPIYVDTNFKDKNPNFTKQISQKHIDNMRVSESTIPRPTLIPVHISPTFAKPEKRAPDLKKFKKEDVDPLLCEPVSVDDSSSDIEVIGEEVIIPHVKDSKVRQESVGRDNKVNSNNSKLQNNDLNDKVKNDNLQNNAEKMEIDDNEADIHKVMQHLREMQDSQDRSLSNSYNSVITSAKHMKASSNNVDIFDSNMSRKSNDKLASFFEQNGWM